MFIEVAIKTGHLQERGTCEPRREGPEREEEHRGLVNLGCKRYFEKDATFYIYWGSF